MKHLPLIVAVILISVVSGSGAYWGSALFRSQAGPVAVAPHTAPAPPDIAAAAGLFGGAPAAAAAIAFKLKGVIADGAEGVAILVEDGKPALAVGIGQQAAPGVTVTEVHQRYVLLDVSGKPTRLDLPDGTVGLELVAKAPATPATSTSPTPAAAPAAPAMPATSVTSATQAASSTPVLAANAGTTPPASQPTARPPGLTNDQMRQQYEARRRQEQEQFERARRATGMAGQASGPQPTT